MMHAWKSGIYIGAGNVQIHRAFVQPLCVQSSCKTHFGREFLCIPEIRTKVASQILLVLCWLFQGRALGEVIACAR